MSVRVMAALCALLVAVSAKAEEAAPVFRAETLSSSAAPSATIHAFNQTDDGFILTTAGILSNGRLTSYDAAGYRGGPFHDVPKAFAAGGQLGFSAFGSGETAAVFRNGAVVRLPQVVSPPTTAVVDIDRSGNILSVNRLSGVIVAYRSDLTAWWAGSLGRPFTDAAFLPDGRVLTSEADPASPWSFQWSVVAPGGVVRLPTPPIGGLNAEFQGNLYSGYITKVTASGCFPFFNTNGYFCLEGAVGGDRLAFHAIDAGTRLHSLNDMLFGTGYRADVGPVLVIPTGEIMPLKELTESAPAEPFQQFFPAVINNTGEIVLDSLLLRPIAPLSVGTPAVAEVAPVNAGEPTEATVVATLPPSPRSTPVATSVSRRPSRPGRTRQERALCPARRTRPHSSASRRERGSSKPCLRPSFATQSPPELHAARPGRGLRSQN